MMLTDEKLPQFQDRIKTLQAVQTKTLKDKRFSELSEEAKLAFCHRNRRLSDYAYACYETLKSRQNSEFDAVDYLMIAFDACNEKAYQELIAAIQYEGIESSDNLVATDNSETNFKQAMCFLLGIGHAKSRASARVLLEGAALNKPPVAYAILGVMYDYGQGVAANKQRAIDLYKDASEQRYAYGQFGLAFLLGRNEKASLYQKASEQGHASAQNNLGYSYRNGIGVDKDIPKANQWYWYAAEQGHRIAQDNLAINLENGDGIPKDLVQSARRHRCAAELGHQESINKLNKSTDATICYHAHMLNAKEQEAFKLIVSNKELIEELLFDLTREFAPENVRESALNILNKLLEKHPDNQEYQRAETAYCMTEILRRFDERKFYTEAYSKDSIGKIGDLLKKINIEYINKASIGPLLDALIDLRYQAALQGVESDIIGAVADLTASLLLKCDAQNNFNLIEGPRNCLLILIRQRFGLDYEIDLSAPLTDEHISMVVSVYRHNKSMTSEELNTFLKLDLIRVSLKGGVILDTLNQLAEYLHVHSEEVSESPRLASMKRYLRECWNSESPKNEMTARTVMTGLHEIIKELQKTPSSGRNGFLISREQDTDVDNLVAKLKSLDYEGVLAHLEKMQAIEQNELK